MNDHLHPVFQQALAPYAPPPSEPSRPKERFVVTIGTRTTARIVMECYATDSCTAVAQHLCLSMPGERVDVRSAE